MCIEKYIELLKYKIPFIFKQYTVTLSTFTIYTFYKIIKFIPLFFDIAILHLHTR